MTKALTKAEEKRIAEYGGLMDETPVDARDILIPKILLMQSQSKRVQEEVARAGEIRGSIDGNLLGEKGKDGKITPVEIIPFAVYKTWIRLKANGGEFVSQEPLTMANASRPREESIDGLDVVNYETLNYYCLLPEEIKAGTFMPYVVSFRSTSYMAGKALESHRAKLAEFKKPLPFWTFKLGAETRENEKGRFYVYTIGKSRDTTDAELDAVKHWHGIVKQQNVRVDESDLEETTAHAAKRQTGEVHEGDEY